VEKKKPETKPTKAVSMKTSAFSIFLACAFAACLLAVPTDSHAQKTTHYTGHLGEIPISVRIVWDNYDGLGNIRGTISYAGRTLSISGSNYQSGRLRFVDSDGDTYHMAKNNTPSTIGWKGSCAGMTVTFSRRR